MSRPAGSRSVISIRLIVATVASTITALAVLIFGILVERGARQVLTQEIENRLILEARNLALTSSDALLLEFPELTLHPLVKELQTRQPELSLVVVIDHEGLIQGHADSRRLGTVHHPPDDLKPVTSSAPMTEDVRVRQNSDLLVVGIPVTRVDGQVLGEVTLGLHRSYINGLLGASWQKGVVILSVVLLAGVFLTLVFMTFLLRPIGVLRQGLEQIGAGDLDTHLELRDRTELGLLAQSINQMVRQLKTAQAAMVERERLAHEVTLAQEIQGSLLPTTQLQAGGFLLDGTQRAAAEVGGDYYDYFRLPDGRFGVAVADVSGKGLAGCMVMSMLSALLRTIKDQHQSPKALLTHLDRVISERLRPGTFITMFYGILNPDTGMLTYASAGHCPTFIYRANSEAVDMKLTSGIPLGAVRNGAIAGTLEDDTVHLGRGDMLIQYTDGINEAFSPGSKEQFGFDRMSGLIRHNGQGGTASVLTQLRQELDRWTGAGPRMDDETVLVVSREFADVNPSEAPARAQERASALELLQAARNTGLRLTLPAKPVEATELFEWARNLPGIVELDDSETQVFLSAVYEACDNIAEHGYGKDPSKSYSLYWVPAEDPHNPLQENYLIITDKGREFSADNWVASDFSDPSVWRQGRGFGLDIIHRAMSDVMYQPGTPDGNVTVMLFRAESNGHNVRNVQNG